MFGGALLDSLVKFVRNALDRYAWHAGTSMVPKRNHFGTIVSAMRLSVKCLLVECQHIVDKNMCHDIVDNVL
jgi:hypothetical protein